MATARAAADRRVPREGTGATPADGGSRRVRPAGSTTVRGARRPGRTGAAATLSSRRHRRDRPGPPPRRRTAPGRCSRRTPATSRPASAAAPAQPWSATTRSGGASRRGQQRPHGLGRVGVQQLAAGRPAGATPEIARTRRTPQRSGRRPRATVRHRRDEHVRPGRPQRRRAPARCTTRTPVGWPVASSTRSPPRGGRASRSRTPVERRERSGRRRWCRGRRRTPGRRRRRTGGP